MLSKVFSSAAIIGVFLISSISAHAVPEGNAVQRRQAEGASLISPENAKGFENAFTVITSIPDSILESGDEATKNWLADTKELQGGNGGAEGASGGSIVDVLRCVASLTEVIVGGIFPAAKLLRLKGIIKSLGGIRKAVEALLANRANLQAASALVKELFELLIGLNEVKKNCF